MNDTEIHSYIKKNQKDARELIGAEFNNTSIIELDLSSSNEKLQALNVRDNAVFRNYLSRELKGRIGIGGYGEDRVFYQKSELFKKNKDRDEPRTVHLGIDLWVEGGIGIHSPLEGKIYSFADNDNYGDYGPTIILEHETDIGEKFHTLYGHLSKISLDEKKVGEKIMDGEAFCTIGNENENGNWPPHLHFQIIIDMEGYKGDYPGVCRKSEKEKYLRNCPDPGLLLQW